MPYIHFSKSICSSFRYIGINFGWRELWHYSWHFHLTKNYPFYIHRSFRYEHI